MTLGSLFSGIGGIDLGFQRAGFEIAWQVEIDDYCRRVLAKHWPDAMRWDKVETFARSGVMWHTEPRVDVIAGGFPCQDVSNAGRREGIKDGNRSGLWSEFSRIIRVVRPRFVVVENVAALLGRGMERILGDLAAGGYDAEWDCFPAAAFGSHHLRDRVFIVANCTDTVCLRSQGEWTASKEPWSREQFAGLVQAELRVSVPAGKSGGISVRVPHRKQRLHALGNAVVPQVAEWIANRIKEAV